MGRVAAAIEGVRPAARSATLRNAKRPEEIGTVSQASSLHGSRNHQNPSPTKTISLFPFWRTARPHASPLHSQRQIVIAPSGPLAYV